MHKFDISTSPLLNSWLGRLNNLTTLKNKIFNKIAS